MSSCYLPNETFVGTWSLGIYLSSFGLAIFASGSFLNNEDSNYNRKGKEYKREALLKAKKSFSN